MNKKRSDKLLDQYYEGLTSLKDEAELINNHNNLQHESLKWFRFLKSQRVNAPNNLEDDIWSTINSKRVLVRKIWLKRMSVAASILIVASLMIINPFSGGNMSTKEKNENLQEAYAMLSGYDEQSSEREVIYEDDILILYTE